MSTNAHPICRCCCATTAAAVDARSALHRSGGTPTAARAWLCGARYSSAAADVALLPVPPCCALVTAPARPGVRARAAWAGAGAAQSARRRTRAKHAVAMIVGRRTERWQLECAMRSGVGELSNGSVNERECECECECARDATRACAQRVVGKRAGNRHRQMATPARDGSGASLYVP